ncbi:MAG: trypsin-like peptidase domain-containing protein [Armatimonas sp.]
MKSTMMLTFVLSATICMTASAKAQELKPEDLYAKLLPSVMTLKVDFEGGKNGIGTGFMCVKDGIAVTAWHVVRGAKQVTAKFSSGEEFDVSGLIDKDEKRDIALIKIKVFGRKLLPSIVDEPKVGSKAFVIGAPKGLEFSFSDGLISQIQNIDGVKQFQFTSSASPGNSGGPLVNANGEVMGVVSWQVVDGQNLNFAVPISYVLGLDSSLPTQPWSTVKSTTPQKSSKAIGDADNKEGIEVSDDVLDKYFAKGLMLESDGHLWAEWVDFYIFQEISGYQSGFPSGAIAIRNDTAYLAKELLNMQSKDRSRDTFRMRLAEGLLRNFKKLDLYARAIRNAQDNNGYNASVRSMINEAEAVHKEKRLIEISSEEIREIFKSKVLSDAMPIDMKVRFGLVKDDVGFDLGAGFLSTFPTQLMYIYRDSIAFKMAFKDGDVILSVDGVKVESLQDFKRLIKENVGKKVKIKIIRRGENQEIERKISNVWDKK